MRKDLISWRIVNCEIPSKKRRAFLNKFLTQNNIEMRGQDCFRYSGSKAWKQNGDSQFSPDNSYSGRYIEFGGKPLGGSPCNLLE